MVRALGSLDKVARILVLLALIHVHRHVVRLRQCQRLQIDPGHSDLAEFAGLPKTINVEAHWNGDDLEMEIRIRTAVIKYSRVIMSVAQHRAEKGNERAGMFAMDELELVDDKHNDHFALG